MDVSGKAQTIRLKLHPASLYGAATAHLNRSAIGKYQSAIASALGGGRNNRSIDLTFATMSNGHDLDAEIVYAAQGLDPSVAAPSGLAQGC